MTGRSVRTAFALAASAVAVSVVLLGFAGSAGAQYNNPVSLAGNTPATNPDGSFTVTLTADGFGPGTTVTFSYNPTLGTAVANGSGVATLVATFPASLAGQSVTVTATGVNAFGQPATATTVVSFGGGSSSGGSSSGSGLAFTGSNTSSVAVRIGAVALVLGVALVLATRSRRRDHVEV
jgi:hypothetical protein